MLRDALRRCVGAEDNPLVDGNNLSSNKKARPEAPCLKSLTVYLGGAGITNDGARPAGLTVPLTVSVFASMTAIDEVSGETA